MLRELLATDQRRALEFFFVHLRDVCEPSVDGDELLYNASVLAHYAQLSTATTDGVPMLPGLSALFDQFVMDATAHEDAEVMETAAAQCLVLAGFFSRAAARQESAHKARLLRTLAREFEPWRRRHARLSRELRDLPYLLRPPAAPGPP